MEEEESGHDNGCSYRHGSLWDVSPEDPAALEPIHGGRIHWHFAPRCFYFDATHVPCSHVAPLLQRPDVDFARESGLWLLLHLVFA